MSLVHQVGPLLDSLVSDTPLLTLVHKKANWIVSSDRLGVSVHTARSRSLNAPAESVSRVWFEDAAGLLETKRALCRSDLDSEWKFRFRSALIFAVLARLPGVSVSTEPELCLTYTPPPASD